MIFENELTKIKRNIYINRAICKLPGKTGSFRDYITIFGKKYGEQTVKEALKKMYQDTKRDVIDIKGLTAAYIIKESKNGGKRGCWK